MAAAYAFDEEDMVVDEGLGYPKAYAKLCRDGGVGIYSHGPPFTFIPYATQQHEVKWKLPFRELCLFSWKMVENGGKKEEKWEMGFFFNYFAGIFLGTKPRMDGLFYLFC